MPTLSLDFKYRKDEELVLSPGELQTLYFYGITIRDRSGQEISPEVYRHFILAAQREVEKYLGIKLKKQIIRETQDFYGDEFKQFGYIQVTYPVVVPFQLVGFLGQVRQIDYPGQWLSSRLTSDRETYFRRVFIVPAQNAEVTFSAAQVQYSGVLPLIGITQWSYIPNYWHVTYCTGFDTIPADLIDIIGKWAAIGIFNIAGDIVLGTAAVANYSLSLDGLSQSVGTTNSAENAAYSARIKNYQKEVKDTLARLRSYYRGVGVTAM